MLAAQLSRIKARKLRQAQSEIKLDGTIIIVFVPLLLNPCVPCPVLPSVVDV